eukprot:3195215-Pyramimonas_sp.AAC.1
MKSPTQAGCNAQYMAQSHVSQAAVQGSTGLGGMESAPQASRRDCAELQRLASVSATSRAVR